MSSTWTIIAQPWTDSKEERDHPRRLGMAYRGMMPMLDSLCLIRLRRPSLARLC